MMKETDIDFSQPQRQSLLGIFIMIADSFQEFARALFPIVVVSLLSEKRKLVFFIIAALVSLTGTLILGYLKYLNFTFFIENDNEFVVRKGIFKKTRIGIPLHKIQQVNINQNFLQRLLNMYELEIDTAGSAATEITIKAVTAQYAQALKERLLQDENGHVHTSLTAEDQSAPFITLSLGSLLKSGITSNYVRSFGILFAFFISTFQHLDEYLTYSNNKDSFLNTYFNTEFLLRFIAIIVFLILFLILLINLARTLLRFYNFRIVKEKNSLLLSHGLINTRNIIIRPEKVQIITIGRNYFQKKFDINDIRIRQASDLEESKDRTKMSVEIPGISEYEKTSLLKFLFGRIPARGFTVKPNYRKIIFESFKYIIVPVTLLYAYTKLIPDIKGILYLIPVYVVLAAILIYFAFRNSRLVITPDFIIRQRGAWDVDNDILEPHKIQGIRLQQYFWQKTSNVGMIKVYTGGGSITFGPANFAQLKKLANYWLYQVETTKKHWM
jgi:putative membrane protein